MATHTRPNINSTYSAIESPMACVYFQIRMTAVALNSTQSKTLVSILPKRRNHFRRISVPSEFTSPFPFSPSGETDRIFCSFRSLPPPPPPASAQPPHKHVNIAAPPLFGLRLLLLRSLHTKIPPLPSFPLERGRKKGTE